MARLTSAGASSGFPDIVRPVVAGVYFGLHPVQQMRSAESVCAMNHHTRAAFCTPDAATEAALDPILLEHRAWLYLQHLELPLPLSL